MSSITEPEITFLTADIENVFGQGGNVRAVLDGMVDFMELVVTPQGHPVEFYRATPPGEMLDVEYRQFIVDDRAAEGTTNHTRTVVARVKRSGRGANELTVGRTEGVENTFQVYYWKESIDGEVITEIDPLNYICRVNGRDLLEEERRALGY